MPVSPTSLVIDRCYLTASGEVRRVVEFEGNYVLYVVGHRGVFPAWDKTRWKRTTKVAFAFHATKEVACG
jgi:hypothetical protein